MVGLKQTFGRQLPLVNESDEVVKILFISLPGNGPEDIFFPVRGLLHSFPDLPKREKCT